MSTFGQRLKQVRALTGMTQADFATTIGISRNPITAAEKDKSVLQPLTIKRICDLFEVREEWLKDGKGEMKEQPYNLPPEEINALLIGYSKLPIDAREHFLAFLEHLPHEKEN